MSSPPGTPRWPATVYFGLALAVLGCRQNLLLASSGVPALAAAAPVDLTGGAGDYALDFGPVGIGEEASAALALENIGAAPLTVTQTAPPTDGAFSLNVGTVTIAAGCQVPLTASYKPVLAGKRSFVIVLQTDSPKIPVLTIILSGEGEKGALTVSPQVVNFGDVVIHTSVSRTITVTNISAFALMITPSAVQGPTGMAFSVGRTDPFPLGAGQAIEVTATYAPVVPSAADSAQFALTPNIGPPIAVSLLGIALESGLQTSPSFLDFSFVAPGQAPTKTVRLVNVGNIPVTIAAVVLAASVGQSSAAYSIPAGLPSGAGTPRVLAPGHELDVPVTFSPPQLGYYPGELRVTAADLIGLYAIPLKGYGGGAAISCSPRGLDFETVAAGFTTTLPIVCTNTGTDVPGHPEAGLTLTSMPTSSGVFIADFDSPSFSQPLAAGQTAQIDVSYRPLGAESDTGTMTVISNVDNGSPAPVVYLAGNAIVEGPCNFDLAPAAVEWGGVPLPVSTPPTLALTVTNLGPNECYLWQLELNSNSYPQAFSLPSGTMSSQRLSPPGGQGPYPSVLTLPIAFVANQAGSYTGAVTFHISSGALPDQIVPLNAIAGYGCITFQPVSLDFGTVGLSNGQLCRAKRGSVVAVNGCTQDVNLTGIHVDAPFAVTATPPLPLHIAQGTSSPPLQLTFEPVTFGTSFATASVYDDISAIPAELPLRGTSVDSATQIDAFPPPDNRPIDILWVMDDDDEDVFSFVDQPNSPSGAFSFPINGFIEASEGMDSHIAVMGDDYCALGQFEPCPTCGTVADSATIIIPRQRNAAKALASLLTSTINPSPSCGALSPGLEGPYEDTMLPAIYAALQPAVLAGHNASFLRDDARLLILVFNGDEAEGEKMSQL